MQWIYIYPASPIRLTLQKLLYPYFSHSPPDDSSAQIPHSKRQSRPIICSLVLGRASNISNHPNKNTNQPKHTHTHSIAITFYSRLLQPLNVVSHTLSHAHQFQRAHPNHHHSTTFIHSNLRNRTQVNQPRSTNINSTRPAPISLRHLGAVVLASTSPPQTLPRFAPVRCPHTPKSLIVFVRPLCCVCVPVYLCIHLQREFGSARLLLLRSASERN